MATIDNLFPGNINAGTTISKVRKTWSPTTDPEKALRNIVKEAYTEKTEEDGALFRTAVCLRVENSLSSKKPDSTSPKSMFGRIKEVVLGQEASAPIEIKCLIPDRDAALPTIYKLPNQAGEGGDTMISIYPTYQGMPGAPVPNPGDLVRVRIDDPINNIGLWYLGLDETNRVPVKSAEDPPKMKFRKRCRGSFCGEAMGGELLDYLNEALEWSTGQHVVKASINVTSDQGAIPKGKGVFTGYPDISTHPLKQAQDVNLSWVCFTGYNQDRVDASADGIVDTDKMKKFVEKYQQNGIRTYVLGYPIHGREQDFIDKILELADAAQTIGIVIDFSYYVPPGSSLTSLKIRNDILFLYNNVFDAAKEAGYSVGVTVSNILEHGNIPWNYIAHSKWKPDFFIPQILAQSAKNEGSDSFISPPSGGGAGNEQSQIRKAEFTKLFDIFIKLGFKNIIPGLGMLGSSPDPEGWSNYYNYGTVNKPPLASRLDIKWAFESTLTNPNAIIWYNWDSINYHSSNWPEKRWDLIKELGDAEAVAEKFNSLPEIDVANKTLIIQNNVETYLNDVVQEFKDFINKNKEHINKSNSFIPNKAIWDARDPYKPPPPELSKEQKKQLEEDIQAKLKQLKENEKTIAEHAEKLAAMGPGLSEVGFKKLYECVGSTAEIDEAFAAPQIKVEAAKEALKQAQEYHEELQIKLVELQQLLETQKKEEGPKEKEESGGCVEEKVPDADPNTGESYSGMKTGGQARKAAWPKELDDIDWSRFETGGDREWLIKKWNKSSRTVTKGNGYRDNDYARQDDHRTRVSHETNKKYTILMWSAAEVMERYWKTILPDAFVYVGSNLRTPKNTSAQHRMAAAIDFEVRYNNKQDTVPHLYTWAITRYLMFGAKRIPAGKSGMYLNVNGPFSDKWAAENPIGISGTSFEEQGLQIKFKKRPWNNNRWKAPGGNTGVHYDIAGAAGFSGYNKGGYYINLNTDGLDSSEILYKTAAAKQWLTTKHPKGAEIVNFIEQWNKISSPVGFPGINWNVSEANDLVPNWNQIIGIEDWNNDEEPLVASAGTN